MDNFYHRLWQYLIIAGLLLFCTLMLMRKLDKTIENQDIMLCESAKISGNVQYLEKCKCYYLEGDVKCLQEAK